jgi:nucleoside-diphosphate-sugar epimerase
MSCTFHDAAPAREGTALIIGATGAFGSHVAAGLLARGWRVRALARDPEAARRKAGMHTPIDWIAGDAMDTDAVGNAARGVDLIVHAANPPRYRNWKGTVLPMLDNTIAAAIAEKARILYPGSVYPFSPDAGPSIGEDVAFAPATRKGAIRVEAERRLAAAAQQGARVLVLRAGDFYGPGGAASALDWLVQGKDRVSRVFVPGRGVGHAFAYLPDLARAAAALVEREGELAPYAVFHFAGHWVEDMGEMVEAVSAAAGRRVPATPFPWLALAAAAPFDETMREMLEMRYLWKRPIGLDNARLVAFLGAEPRTPLAIAVAATLEDRGLLGLSVRQASPGIALASAASSC